VFTTHRWDEKNDLQLIDWKTSAELVVVTPTRGRNSTAQKKPLLKKTRR
jgi:hypothetical protein